MQQTTANASTRVLRCWLLAVLGLALAAAGIAAAGWALSSGALPASPASALDLLLARACAAGLGALLLWWGGALAHLAAVAAVRPRRRAERPDGPSGPLTAAGLPRPLRVLAAAVLGVSVVSATALPASAAAEPPRPSTRTAEGPGWPGTQIRSGDAQEAPRGNALVAAAETTDPDVALPGPDPAAVTDDGGQQAAGATTPSGPDPTVLAPGAREASLSAPTRTDVGAGASSRIGSRRLAGDGTGAGTVEASSAGSGGATGAQLPPSEVPRSEVAGTEAPGTEVVVAQVDVTSPGWTPTKPVKQLVAAGPGLVLEQVRSADDDVVVVRRGDTLWDVCARHLGPDATGAEVAAEWPRWYEANRAVIGSDPDHIEPGQRLQPPTGPP